jgi:hypothetical protein
MKRFSPARIAWVASALIHIGGLAALAIWGGSEPIETVQTVTVNPSLEKPIDFLIFTPEEEPVSVPVVIAPPVEPPPMPTPPVAPPVESMEPRMMVKDVIDLNQAQYTETTKPEIPKVTPSVAETPVNADPFVRSLETTPALHGSIPDGRSIVYLLDRSASMALVRESFAAGRAAVYQSVASLPAGAKFEVLTYESSVASLTIHGRETWLKQDTNTLRTVRYELEKLTAEGRSRHDVGLRKAVGLEPDYIVLITDAEDSELESLRPILHSARRPLMLYVARVVSGKVSALRAFK